MAQTNSNMKTKIFKVFRSKNRNIKHSKVVILTFKTCNKYLHKKILSLLQLPTRKLTLNSTWKVIICNTQNFWLVFPSRLNNLKRNCLFEKKTKFMENVSKRVFPLSGGQIFKGLFFC